MAVELCKTALWIETVEPGKPLTFLDAHILCGNSLVGLVRPYLNDGVIPSDAYTALTGDDKSVCRDLKKRNDTFVTEGVQQRFEFIVRETFGETKSLISEIEDMPEDTIEDVKEKQQAWMYARSARAVSGRLNWKPTCLLLRSLRQKPRIVWN